MSLSPNPSDAECWYCRRPADPASVYVAVLVSDASEPLDPLGFPVRQRGRRRSVRVPVPRCRVCRERFHGTLLTALLGTLAGAIAAPLLWLIYGSHDGPRPWWTGGADPGHLMVGVGAVLGFALALYVVRGRRRRLGLRPLTRFPPITALRRRGWHWPTE